MTNLIDIFPFVPITRDDLCSSFNDEVEYFDSNKYIYFFFDPSAAYDKCDYVTDAFHLAQIVPACDYYSINNEKKRISSNKFINMLPFSIQSKPKHLEVFFRLTFTQ